MLISRQQHVIRQTHQHLQNPQAQENLQAQDRKKLSEAEADLGDSAQHLYAEMAGKMENKPIGEALDNLAKAEKSLGPRQQAAGGQCHERGAEPGTPRAGRVDRRAQDVPEGRK